MAEESKASVIEQARIVLGLLEYVERGGEQSQRWVASELDAVLGLANACFRRCAKNRLVKVSRSPARRYAYYLTPHSFAIAQATMAKFGAERVFVPAFLHLRASELQEVA